MTIPLVIGVNPLQTTLVELGIVSGRVALLLRSAEIQPLFVRFVKQSIIGLIHFKSMIPYSLTTTLSQSTHLHTLSLPSLPTLAEMCYKGAGFLGGGRAENDEGKLSGG